MSIAGASSSLVKLLQQKYVERHGDLGGFTIRPINSGNLTPLPSNQITLLLYRVGVQPCHRHVELPRAGPVRPSRISLGLELRYLLTVWADNAEGQQQVLGNCMEILDQHAQLAGDLLDPAYSWEDGEELAISLEHMSNEDLMRLWDSLDPPYQLSVPYVVRTVRLRPTQRTEAPPVDARVNVYVPHARPPR